MQTFSLKSLGMLLIVSCNFLLLACTLPKPQNRQNEAASFVVENKDPKVIETTTIPGFSLPQSRTIHFESCISDVKLLKPVINHRFTISSSSLPTSSPTASQEVVTDAKGCLDWNEKVSFNYFGDAQFVTMERALEAHGLQKGSRVLKFAVNPWESQVVDLEKTTIAQLVPSEQSAAALQAASTHGLRSILAGDLRVNISEKQTTANGLTLNMEIRGTPSVENRKASGEKTFDPLSEGQFKAEVHLIHVMTEGSKEVRRDLFASDSIAVKSIHGQLSLKLPITLPPNCVRGQYQLGLKLTAVAPADSTSGAQIAKLKPFEGVFFLSECDQLKGNFFAALTNESSTQGSQFSIEKYVQETPELKENIKTTAQVEGLNGFQKMGFEFSKITPSDYAYKDRSPLHRERQFLLRTCVFSGLDAKPLRAQTLTVKKANGQIKEITTSNLGCLEWDDSVAFDFFAKECKQKYSVEISNESLGIKKTIPLLINPWSGMSNAIEDITETKMQPRCADGLSELRTLSYDFSKSGFRYGVDEFLNLKVKKTGIFSLSLALKRPSLTAPSGYDEGPAPIGKYRIKLALVDASADPLKDLSQMVFMTAEKVIQLNGQSTLAAPLTLEAMNLKSNGNTNKLWIEVMPEEQSSQFKPLVFQGTLKFADEVSVGNLFELSPEESGLSAGKSLVDLARTSLEKDQARELRAQATLATKVSTAQELNLTLLNLNTESDTLGFRSSLANPYNPQAAPLSSEVLQSWLNSGVLSSDLAKKFCAYWINSKLERAAQALEKKNGLAGPRSDLATANQVLVKQCQWAVEKNPFDIFDVQYRYFTKNPRVLEADSKAKDNHSEGDGQGVVMQDFTISNTFNYGRAFVESHSVTKTVDASFGMSTPKFLLLSASSGFRYSSAWAKQWGEQTATAQTYVGAITFKTEKIPLKIVADSLEKCAVIKLRPELYLAADSNLQKNWRANLKAKDKVSLLKQGLMICSGKPSAKAMTFVENYYIMNQFQMGAQASDSSTSKNRPFFMALRGDESFVEFLSFVHKGTGIPETYLGEFQTQELLRNRHKALFLKGLPGSPGQFIAPI